MDKVILRNLFRNVDVSFLKEEQRVLAFYKLMIELERMKEPDIKEYYDYPLNFYKNERLMLVDFPCNKQFTQIFEKNRNRQETKFPSDLYIGLKITTGDVAYRLLNMVIDFNDIKIIDTQNELLPIKIANFEVNLKEAARLELLPEKIDAINSGIKADPTWSGMLSLLRAEISEDVKIENTIYLALSSKSIELSQIYSELNNKRLDAVLSGGMFGETPPSTLLKQFLMNDSIDNVVDNVSTEELLEVTELDESQKLAVQQALNSKVSVITGAPGTGKTQVIENILANALFKGKKVLVASKNNKAVDNVKDRFDIVDPTGYFLRFGSKQLVSTSTLPSIEKILNEIGNLKDNSQEYEMYKSKHADAIQKFVFLKKEFLRKQKLENEIAQLKGELQKKQEEYEQLGPSHETRITNIEKTYADYLSLKDYSDSDLDRYSSSLKKLENTFSAKFSGFFGFWHRSFSVTKYASILLNEVESFPYQLKEYARSSKYGLSTSISDFKSNDYLLSQIKTWLGVISKGQSLRRDIRSENNRYERQKRETETAINVLNDKINTKDNEQSTLVGNLPHVVRNASIGRKWIKDNSKNILAAFIHYNKIQNNAIRSINLYKPYLPDNIPWKDEDYKRFVHTANDFLNIFKLCSVTSLSTKNAFPLEKELFDMVVIDEASQCDIASAIPLIMRTKQLVVIGDPMQLRHISAVKSEEEQEVKEKLGLNNSPYVKYAEHSLYDYCKAFIANVSKGMNTPLMLKFHYRCYPSIIGYSNDLFYGGVLGDRLVVKTDLQRLKGNPQGIVWVNVQGRQVNDNLNINEAEAKKAVELAVRAANAYPDVSIGIVTPFRHQAEKINSLIPANYADRIEANTVHKYQGDEKDIMIYSLVVTTNSPDRKIYWIDNIVPNLVNVAVTRAKSTLCVVGNLDYVLNHSRQNQPLGYLARYNNGK